MVFSAMETLNKFEIGEIQNKQRGKELNHLTAFSIDQSSSLSKKTKRRLTRYRNKMELRRFNNK